MKVNLQGSIFRYPMDFNEVTLAGNRIMIHNSDNVECGHVHQYKNPIEVSEEIKFILNKKDYTLLSTLESFDLEMKDDVITATSIGFKAKFANMKDVHLNSPNTDQCVPLGIEYLDLYKGKAFTGNKDITHIQLDGATVKKDKVIISDGKRIYQKAIKNDGVEVNIPFEIFKHLDPTKEYQISSDGKVAIFIDGGHAFYTALIGVLVNIKTIEDEGTVDFKVDKDTFLTKLKLLKGYANDIRVVVEGNAMEMTAENEGNIIDVKMPIVPVKLKKLVIKCNATDMIALMSIVESGEVHIKVTDRMVIVGNKDEGIVAFSGLIACQDMEVSGDE